MIDQATLACILALGYPPARHLGDKPKPLFSRDMGDADLNEYCRIVEGTIISRASEYENWVELSGGWDSTIILATLRKHFEADKVRAIFYTADLADGRCFNIFELEKVTAIAKYYSVRLDTVKLNPADPEMIELWKSARASCPGEWMQAYWAMAKAIKEKNTYNGTVFVGSFADSLHNFGFSQLMSLPYLSYGFRSYGDKMMSYLYSPSFFRKVIENNYHDDFVYQLFRWLIGHIVSQLYAPSVFFDYTDLKQRVFRYLLSFILSKSRLPFASISNHFLTVEGEYRFLQWLYANYFEEVVEQITPETLYYWLIYLYQQFHLQGAERINVMGSFADSNILVCQPYTDTRLIEFLQQMPEDWGRGLEWRPTKYPLKQYGARLKIPSEIIETEFHSYITETPRGRIANLHSELAQALVSSITKEIDFDLFDPEWFRIDALKKILTPQKGDNPKLLLNLLGILAWTGRLE